MPEGIKGFRGKSPGERETDAGPTMKDQMWNRFYREARKLGKHWKGCHACPPGKRDPKALLQVHHVVSQRRLKRLAKDRKMTPLELLRLLTDPRNSMLVCETCHDRHTLRHTPLPRSAISEAAWEFIYDWHLEEEIMKEYPE